MDKKDFKDQSFKEKFQNIFAFIILVLIVLFMISQCGGGDPSYKSSTRGLMIGH